MQRTLGDSSAAAELVMATTAVKGAMSHRIQAEELRQGAHGSSRPYLDASSVLRGASPDKATRGMKYLAAVLAIVQDDKAERKTCTVKSSGALHNSGILTKPPLGEEFVYKRARLLWARGHSTGPAVGAGPGCG